MGLIDAGGGPRPARVRRSLWWMAAMVPLVLIVACRSLPPRSAEPVTHAPAVLSADAGAFALRGISRLDAWNAVGQILVRTPGVTYGGRSQMMGIYDVRYRGESFLIVTRGRAMQTPTDGMVTAVAALGTDGSPYASEATVELLGLLQQRLPEELALIDARGRDD